jgi:hypothetical protein
LKDEKETTPGAANTESGQTKESEPSVPDISEKVKMAQMAGMPFCMPEIKVAHSLDVHTEMFMLDALRESLNKNRILDYRDKWDILSGLIGACTEANGI